MGATCLEHSYALTSGSFCHLDELPLQVVVGESPPIRAHGSVCDGRRRAIP